MRHARILLAAGIVLGGTSILMSADSPSQAGKEVWRLPCLNREQGYAEISAMNQSRLRYVFGGKGFTAFKPYVSELLSPKGVNPLRDNVPDHVHHHGLMFAVAIDGVDFWSETKNCGREIQNQIRDEAVRLVSPFSPASMLGRSREEIADIRVKWAGPDGKTVLADERRTIIIYPVTLQRPGGSKIYNSVNKLFMLSKYHPVGVMVYGMADFTGVPWETIVKEYRSRLGHRSFPQLRGYIEDFLGFLDPRSGLFSQEEQDRYFRRAVYGCFGDIRKGIDKQVDKAIRDKGSVTLNQIRIICTSVIKSVRNDYDRTPDLVCFQTVSMKALVSKYRKDIDAIRKDVFENLPLSATTQRLLCDVAICIFLNTLVQNNS